MVGTCIYIGEGTVETPGGGGGFPLKLQCSPLSMFRYIQFSIKENLPRNVFSQLLIIDRVYFQVWEKNTIQEAHNILFWSPP